MWCVSSREKGQDKRGLGGGVKERRLNRARVLAAWTCLGRRALPAQPAHTGYMVVGMLGLAGRGPGDASGGVLSSMTSSCFFSSFASVHRDYA